MSGARLAYRALVRRVLARPGVDPALVARIAREADLPFETLLAYRSDSSLSDEKRAAFVWLAETVTSAELDEDALFGWLTSFPSAVADLFPPSRETFDLVSADGSRVEDADDLPDHRVADLVLVA